MNAALRRKAAVTELQHLERVMGYKVAIAGATGNVVWDDFVLLYVPRFD